MDFKKDYFIKAAEDNNVSVKEYYESSNPSSRRRS